MSKIPEKIINKLKEYDIDVYDSFKTKDDDIIIANKMTISSKNKEVFISFHINCKPSYSARMVLILNEIKEIKEFFIGDDFTFDQNGKFLDGEEAESYNEIYKKNDIIQDFMKQQSELYFLNTAKYFNC